MILAIALSVSAALIGTHTKSFSQKCTSRISWTQSKVTIRHVFGRPSKRYGAQMAHQLLRLPHPPLPLATAWAGLMRWIHRAVLDFNVPVDITADQAVTDLRNAGAVRWANLLFPISPRRGTRSPRLGATNSPNGFRKSPRLVVFMSHDPDPLGVVQEAVEDFGMAGLKFHPMVQGFNPWDQRLACGTFATWRSRALRSMSTLDTTSGTDTITTAAGCTRC